MDQLTFEDKLKREGFTQVENCIIRSPKVSPFAKTVYFQLCSYAWDGTGYPGRDTLALQNGVHVNTIDKYIKELKDAKLITVKRRGVNKSNLYTIKSITRSLHAWLEPIHRLESHGGVSPVIPESHGGVSQESQERVSQESHGGVKEEDSVKKDSVKKDTVTKKTRRQQVDYDSDFEEFYKAYPKSVDPSLTKRSYEKQRKKGVSHEQIMFGVRCWVKQIADEKIEKRYIKASSSWLNAGSYLNYGEYDAEVASTQTVDEEELERLRNEKRKERGFI